MIKILYKVLNIEHQTIKYYLTTETKSDMSFYGVMVTAKSDTGSCSAYISDVFPYEQNALEFLMYLHKHCVTPLSMRDITMDYLDNKFVIDSTYKI